MDFQREFRKRALIARALSHIWSICFANLCTISFANKKAT
ncbi:hypothetical protein HMPREF1584_01335 [Gardnerella vaginalis JCP8481A]|nr:hypothetical protein HMPREF1584_01335 [Gardnerella vaginalis JCP8481A]